MKKLLAVLLCVVPVLSHAGEAEVRKAAESFVNGRAQVDSVRKVGVMGLYEVQIGQDIIYMDETGKYAFFGDIVDLKSRMNLTEERKNKLSQIKFSDLPLNMAIKQVRGNGKRVFQVSVSEHPADRYTYSLELRRGWQSGGDASWSAT